MAKLSSRTAAVVGDIVDTVIFWMENAGSSSTWKATWLTIRTKLETYFPTRAEVTAEIASAVAGLYDHKGAYDASTNTPDLDTSPSGIKKGDAYTVSVAGTFYAVAVAAGDVLIADQDDPTTAAHWTIVNRNIDESLILDQAAVDARVVAKTSGIQSWQFRAHDFTVVTGETTRSQILNSITTLDAVNFPATAGYHWATVAFFLPKRWDAGEFRFRIGWATSNTNTGTVEFGLYAHTLSDGEAFPTSFGSLGMTVSDAGSGTAKTAQISAWSAWSTMSAEPAENAVNLFRIQRNKDAVGDTYNAAADLFLLEIQWRSDAPTDD